MSSNPQYSGRQTPEEQATLATRLLSELLKQPGGLSLAIEGEEQEYTIHAGEISNVKVNSAWIAFSHGGCTFRTKEIKDRELFWTLLVDGSVTGKVRFMKTCGTLTRPQKIEPEPKTGFVPRSQYRREHTVSL